MVSVRHLRRRQPRLGSRRVVNGLASGDFYAEMIERGCDVVWYAGRWIEQERPRFAAFKRARCGPSQVWERCARLVAHGRSQRVFEYIDHLAALVEERQTTCAVKCRDAL